MNLNFLSTLAAYFYLKKNFSFDGLSFDVIQWMPFTPWRTPFIGWSPTFADPTLANCATNSNRRHPDDICSNIFVTSILSVNQKSFLFFLPDFVFKTNNWTGPQGQPVRFNKDGDAYGSYSFYQYQRHGSKYDYVRIGDWSASWVVCLLYFLFFWVAWSFIAGSCERERETILPPSGDSAKHCPPQHNVVFYFIFLFDDRLVLNMSMLAWPNSTRGTIPRSICSDSCPNGYIRNFQVKS